MSEIWMELGPSRGLTEKQFQAQVVEIAGLYGFSRIHHEAFSVGTKPGYPDLTLVNTRHGGVVWLELKGPKGKVHPKQVEWIRDLQRAGQHAYIAKPEDMDIIQHILRGDYPPPEVGTGNPHPDLEILNIYLF